MEGGYNIFDVLNRLNTLPLGAVVATAELVECWECIGPDRQGDLMILNRHGKPDWENSYVGDDELVYGDFNKGRFAWDLANVKVLDKPIPVRGMQGLWTWDEEGWNENRRYSCH